MGTGAGGRQHGLCRVRTLSQSGLRSAAAAVVRSEAGRGCWRRAGRGGLDDGRVQAGPGSLVGVTLMPAKPGGLQETAVARGGEGAGGAVGELFRVGALGWRPGLSQALVHR